MLLAKAADLDSIRTGNLNALGPEHALRQQTEPRENVDTAKYVET